jgi:hypothetical protein
MESDVATEDGVTTPAGKVVTMLEDKLICDEEDNVAMLELWTISLKCPGMWLTSLH